MYYDNLFIMGQEDEFHPLEIFPTSQLVILVADLERILRPAFRVQTRS
jgi:hypothetical protein